MLGRGRPSRCRRHGRHLACTAGGCRHRRRHSRRHQRAARPEAAAVPAIHFRAGRVIWMTSADGGREHAVADEEMAAGQRQRSRVYQAVCGHPITPGSLVTPPGRPCPQCVDALDDQPRPTWSARRLRRPRRAGRRSGRLLIQGSRGPDGIDSGDPPEWSPVPPSLPPDLRPRSRPRIRHRVR